MSVSKLTPKAEAIYSQERLDEALNDQLSRFTIETFGRMSEELYINYTYEGTIQIEDLLEKKGARPNKQSLKILNKQIKKIQKIRKKAEAYLASRKGNAYSFFFYRSGVSNYRDLHHDCPDGLFEIDKISNMILEAYKPEIQLPSEELQKLQDELYQL
ncbi:MAG: hypothetical protein K940chlam5_01702 [Candidatus Anoxychlamydiales bacterium]|nr:hypothetical protein [Candidatus Anoxychlamydiales bacterium]